MPLFGGCGGATPRTTPAKKTCDRSCSRKAIIVGDGDVGKTSSLISYTTGVFPADYVPNAFDNTSASEMVDGKTVSLGLWDTIGQADYDRLRPLSYPDTDVIVLLYSVVNRDSFTSVSTRWRPEMDEHLPGIPIVLVGNKIDLRNDDAISGPEGEALARTIGAVAYVDASAKTQEGLKAAFEAAIRACI